MEISHVPPAPHECTAPRLTRPRPDVHLLQLMTNIDSSVSPKVHSLHYGSLLMLFILWTGTNI